MSEKISFFDHILGPFGGRFGVDLGGQKSSIFRKMRLQRRSSKVFFFKVRLTLILKPFGSILGGFGTVWGGFWEVWEGICGL